MDKYIKSLPQSPGIYQFFNDAGEIIYIGKSVNLKNRVSSYFNGQSKLNFAKKLMVDQIVDIKTIVTNNETESLILEHTLVGEKKPKFNVLLKDDKNYLYIKVTSEKFPKIIKTRIPPSAKGKQTGNYYGPYTNGPYVFNILRLAKKIFGYGCYGIHFFRLGNEYNLDKYIFKNHTHDGENISEKQVEQLYREKIQEIQKFLKGDLGGVVSTLTEKMKTHADNLEFEQAAKIKYDIDSLQMMQEHQIVRDFVSGDFDVVNILEKYGKYYVGCIQIRDSKIVGFFNYEIKNHLEETNEEILTHFIEQRFTETLSYSEKETNGNVIPAKAGINKKDTVPLDASTQGHNTKTTFILPFFLPNLSTEIQTEIPKIGGKLDILKLCYKNIYEYAHKKHLASLSTKGFTKKTMSQLLDILGYEQINKSMVFECNDISHLSGTHTVASRSIIENGKKNSAKYRKFNIKNLAEGKIDDFGSMKEIMERRLKEIIKIKTVPDLIIIDGGKGQLSSVMKVIEEFKSSLLPVIPAKAGINKKDTVPLHSDGFLPSQEGHNSEIKKQLQLIDSLQIVSIAKREEELFLPVLCHPEGNEGSSDKSTQNNTQNMDSSTQISEGHNLKFKKILLDKDSDHLRLIQSLRDEAHRFAITFNRDKRISSMKKSILESLPGIGPVTRKKIIKNYGSAQGLKGQKKEDVERLLGEKVAEVLEDHGLI